MPTINSRKSSTVEYNVDKDILYNNKRNTLVLLLFLFCCGVVLEKGKVSEIIKST